MDLINGILAFKQATFASQVQTKVARKVLDMAEFQGNAAVQLIQAAGKTAEQGGDAMVAAATGLGGELDIYG